MLLTDMYHNAMTQYRYLNLRFEKYNRDTQYTFFLI